ncbi:MAG TPA: ATP-binding protein [Chloroflexota bacterium]|nr:ATP-binding protein [Chloroflexota bacterium]
MTSPALISSEERFQLLVDSVRDHAIFMLDPDGYVATWNPGAERIKGYTADEIVGQHFSRFYPPEDVAAGMPQRVLRRAAEQGRSSLEGWRVRKDGTRFWGQVTIGAIHREGQLLGFAKVTRDMTAHRQADEERQRRLAAEEAAQLRSEFLSIAAHELKTPITSLRGMAQLTLRRFQRDGQLSPERIQHALTVINEQSGKLSRLVEQLLDTSRLESGHLILDRSDQDLVQVVRSVLTMFAGRPDSSRVTLDVPDHPVTASVDALRLEQVITNLVDNALKYSPHDCPVSVSLERTGPTGALIIVEDRGPGVPPEDRPRLFDRFYRARSTAHTTGMGLGLYVSQQIVQLHGGTLTAEFPPDDGTRMVLTLST